MTKLINQIIVLYVIIDKRRKCIKYFRIFLSLLRLKFQVLIFLKVNIFLEIKMSMVIFCRFLSYTSHL